ncbi:MAG TPA: GIY-YIG nuclease family protein [Candidatus Wunengus sp. YC61]|uniref:GIY-YIG nuclease family protein n=1 Tax=Candidatus Wunengus sp. YC61 TaxID=3367698 RepID=UPI004024E064
MKKTAGIYKIENLIDGKCYIGSSAFLERRLKDHRRILGQNRHGNVHLQRAWDKYGEESFKFEIIEICDNVKLLEREQYHIDKLCSCASGYNISPTAGNSLGRIHSDTTKKKISLRALGRKTGPCSEERRKNISIAHTGKKQTEERKRKAVEGRIRNGGYHHTPESKKKISQATKGIPKSEQAKLNISAGRKGITFSEEHKKHISESKIGVTGRVLSFESLSKRRTKMRVKKLFNEQQKTSVSVGL